MSHPSRTAAILSTVEAAVIVAVLGLNIAKVTPFATGTLLFVLPNGWLSMRIRKVSWSSVWLSLPSRWPRVVSIGTVGGVAIQALTSLVIDPLMKWAGLAAPTVDGVTNLASSGVVGLALTLLLVWFVGGFLEELCFRG